MACRYSFSAVENCLWAKYSFPFSTCNRARAVLRHAGRTTTAAARKTSARRARRPRKEALQRDRIIFILRIRLGNKVRLGILTPEAGRNGGAGLGSQAFLRRFTRMRQPARAPTLGSGALCDLDE